MSGHAVAKRAQLIQVMAPVVSDADIAEAMRLAPAWVNAARLRQVLDVLQPYYPDQRPTAENAVEIMNRIGKLFELFSTDRKVHECPREER